MTLKHWDVLLFEDKAFAETSGYLRVFLSGLLHWVFPVVPRDVYAFWSIYEHVNTAVGPRQ